jgi:hypothetical protein
MKTSIVISAVAVMALSSTAFAAGHFNGSVQTPSGNTVWNLDVGETGVTGGANRGGNGKTEKAAGGLANAAIQNDKGLSIVVESDD